MSDQDPISPASPPPAGNGEVPQADDQPQVAALAQYIKDLSVENPSSPQVFQWQDPPQLDVQFNINVNRASEDVHEVVLKIDASARSASGVHFVVDLSYAGLFALRNVPEDSLPPFLLVEAPRLLFPFARQVIASAVQDAGFPPLMLDPINFEAVYMSQAQAATPGDAEGSEPVSIGGGAPTVQ
jgi:preprotein translocase subunit SecB